MAITVGTNSYVTLAEADAYFEERDDSTWAAATDEAKEAALLYAVKWVDARYRWIGILYDSEQSLDWPRGEAYGLDGRDYSGDVMPQRIKDLQIEAARAHLDDGLHTPKDRGGAVKRTRDKVGTLETEVEYVDGASGGRTYGYLDSLARPLTRAGGSRLVRA